MRIDLPMDRETVEAWKARIEHARSLREPRERVWKNAIQEGYLGQRASGTDDEVVVNKSFPFVEQKKAQLVFQVPEVSLKPKRPGLEQAVHVFQAALNHELGPDGAHAKRMFDACLFDVLTCGIAASKIGYAAFLGERTVTGPNGKPRRLPTLAHEEYFWRRVSPDKLLLPVEFEGDDFDDADWLGMEFEKDLETAIRDYKLPKDFDGGTTEIAKSLSGEKDAIALGAVTKKVKGVEIWYRAHRFDPDAHPLAYRCLVLLEGQDDPVRHSESPYQRPTPDGKLGGMRGSPIHLLTLRTIAGSAYPPSDVEMARHIEDELSKGRTQMIQQRDRNIPLRWADQNRLSPDQLKKIIDGDIGSVTPVDGNGNEIIGEVARANFPRENFTFNEICAADYEDIWAIGKNQRGLRDEGARTATEIQVMQGAADLRLDAERTRVLGFFTSGAKKFGSLLQLFKDEASYIEIVGEDGQQALMQWDKTAIQGEFAYDVKADSALRIDRAMERKQLLDLYNLTANDPNVARVELLKQLLRAYHLDPTRIVVEQLPPAPPEKPRVSLSFKGEDLAIPAVWAILKEYGLEPGPGAEQPPQGSTPSSPLGPLAPPPPHGGAGEPASPLSKHGLRGRPDAPLGVQ